MLSDSEICLADFKSIIKVFLADFIYILKTNIKRNYFKKTNRINVLISPTYINSKNIFFYIFFRPQSGIEMTN